MSDHPPYMFSESEVQRFRNWAAKGKFPSPRNPEGAFDSLGPSLKRRLAMDNTGPNPDMNGKALKKLRQLIANMADKNEKGQAMALLEQLMPGSFEGVEDADPASAVEEFLKDKLSDSDLARVCGMLRGDVNGDDDIGGPERFRGMPERGGKMIGDSRRMALDEVSRLDRSFAGFSRRFPNAAKVGIV